MCWWLSKHILIRLQASMVQLTFAERMSWQILRHHILLILITCYRYPQETPYHISVLSPMRCLTDMYSDGNTGSNRSDRPHQPVRSVHLNWSDWSYRLVRPVPPVMRHQTSRTCLPPHSQIHQLLLRNFLLNVKMVWLR